MKKRSVVRSLFLSVKVSVKVKMKVVHFHFHFHFTSFFVEVKLSLSLSFQKKIHQAGMCIPAWRKRIFAKLKMHFRQAGMHVNVKNMVRRVFFVCGSMGVE